MSTLKVSTLQNLSGTEVYTCKAWVNFNGTGTVAIRASGNVSSITDNGTGDYTVNFTTAMPDANYSAVTTSITSGNTQNWTTPTMSFAVGSCKVLVLNPGVSFYDSNLVSAAFFR
jgi:hypothetical protein